MNDSSEPKIHPQEPVLPVLAAEDAANSSTVVEFSSNQEASSRSKELLIPLAQVEATLADLKQLFEHRLRYDQAKEKAFDVLYDKMKQHERGFQASLKENLVLSLLLLYDNMVRTEADLKQDCEPASDRVALLRQELLNILYAENVEPIGELERFDRQRQKPVRVIATDNPTLHASIEQVVREGFVFEEKVIRPQSVVLRHYEPSDISES
jgi:molecular chaperone GrpE